jgi:hypothetical protein
MKLFVIIILLFIPAVFMGQNGKHNSKSKNLDKPFIVIDDVENYVYFPGGDSAFKIFFNKNVSFSDSIMQPDTSGTVLVSFQIDITGKVSNIMVIQGLSKKIDREIVRVMSLMPDWEWDKRIDSKKRKDCTKQLPIKITMPIDYD